VPERDPVVAHSRAMIRGGSKSFFGAARLFERATRESAFLLYAWCRHCDDQVDGETLGFKPGSAGDGPRRARLDELVETTRRALRGEPTADPVFQALQRVTARHAIPERYPLELLEGFAMDVEGRRYATADDLFLYCYHVAGVVGVMMAHVMGVRDPQALQRAADLGLALQLTNIARDVVEDAACGRVYLPLDWLAEAGVAPEAVAEPRHRAAVAATVARLLDAAAPFYASGDEGIRHLPWRSAWAVSVARRVYARIGERVRRLGPRAWDARVVVPRWLHLATLASGLAQALHATGVSRRLPVPPRPSLWRKREPSLDADG
jgi:phytoene synthase